MPSKAPTPRWDLSMWGHAGAQCRSTCRLHLPLGLPAESSRLSAQGGWTRQQPKFFFPLGGGPEMGARVRMSQSRYGCAGLSSSHRSDLSYAKGSDSLQGLSVRCGAERSISSPVLWLAGPSDPRRPMGFARLCPNCSATSASRAQVGTGLASDSATAASVVMSHHTALHVRLEEEAHLVVLTG